MSGEKIVSLKNGIGLHLEENKVYISHTVYPTSEPIQRALQFRAKGTGTVRRQVQAGAGRALEAGRDASWQVHSHSTEPVR